jgi:hypothetical protein
MTGPEVTLSFDNGPEPEATPRVLDVLARRGIPASFFVIGAKLADPARRSLCERAQAEGHWIGNHTTTHAGPLGSGTTPGMRRPRSPAPRRCSARSPIRTGCSGRSAAAAGSGRIC